MERTFTAAALAAFATLAGLGAAPAAAAEAKLSDGVVRIGVLTDMTGYYSDLSGPGSALAAKMAIDDFGGKIGGKPIELVSADHQLKADVASNIARKWFDEQKVDVIADLVSSSTALAAMPVAAEKKRILLLSGPGTTGITGDKCNAYTVHYTYDNWALANGTGREVVNDGGKTWFFITADYAFGHDLEKQASEEIAASGGKILGAVRHPLGASDFSSFLLQAQASGADVVALANAGGDMINAIKQANEFGLTRGGQKVVSLLTFITDIQSVGLAATQGLTFVTAFYWDRDAESRAWSERFFQRHKR
ncbi:MAG TPA: ABC transporter substrate-binding protein, partial [Anaeromyxobacteraceae bacterium]|nr:ABC transporter substrate-binding protein [Anaeromyxobacteraceae bacterium]